MALRAWTAVDPEDARGSVRCVRVNLTAGTGAGSLAAIANPFGERAAVLECILDVTTQATGAATVDIGVAANATTSADTLIDGKDIGTAAVLASSSGELIAGTGNAAGVQAIGATAYVTASPSATSAGIVGTLQVVFVKLATVS